MVSVTAQADQCGRRGADETALGRLSGQLSRRSPTAEATLFLCRFGLATPHRLAPGELLVEVLRGSSRRRFEMNPLLMVYFSAGTSFAGLGLVKLQARLERWAYERHAED
jgi:hypothetical protein